MLNLVDSLLTYEKRLYEEILESSFFVWKFVVKSDVILEIINSECLEFIDL